VTSPYVTPSVIANAPTGVPWNLIPEIDATALAKYAEQSNVCWRASAEADRICNQPLRATVDIEEEDGPDFRLTLDPGTNVARMLASRWPVVSVIGAQVSPAAAFPPSWKVLPPNQVRARAGVFSAYGSTIPGSGAQGQSEFVIAPGYVTWTNGRNGTTLQVGYLSGWPHAGLTATAAQNTSTLAVDDVTAFLTAAPFIYDGANTEQVYVSTVTANSLLTVMGVPVPAGPGTVTLSSPLQYTHTVTPGQDQILVSSMTPDMQWAVILLCASMALEAGIEGIVISDVHGGSQSSGGGAERLAVQAEVILNSYRRSL
jgi:hypothetical protein